MDEIDQIFKDDSHFNFSIMLHMYYMHEVPQEYHIIYNWRELFNIKIQKSPLTFGESTSQGRYQVL